MTFPHSKDIERLGKFIRVNTYIDNNTYDINLFMEVIKKLESGEFVWNEKTNKLIINKRKIRRR
ncbi:hypothetical protein AYK24_06600 [Thermoplasmatales archaeon SG8-52-4]|nr:MAG: hypothetical protein AYK24_06600 [Thermoplasmatales archaeon SG8-52-4]